MSEKKHFVVFSHGFGVRYDDRGLFTDIADGLEDDIESVMFDYNEIDEERNVMIAKPFSEQAKLLRGKIEEISRKDPEAVIDLVAHSQGCVVAALAEPEGVRKVILLSPPCVQDVERSLEKYAKRPGAAIDLEGESRIPKSDGSTALVPAGYWSERAQVDFSTLYECLTRMTDLTFVQGANDTVLGTSAPSALPESAKILSIPGDHDFSGDDRTMLVETAVNLLLESTNGE